MAKGALYGALLALSMIFDFCALCRSTEVNAELRKNMQAVLNRFFLSRSSSPVLSTSNSLYPKGAASKSVELAEEALRLIYQELYGFSNNSRASRAFFQNSRQSFLSNGLASLSEYLMSLVENSLEDFPSLPRLEAQECMKRSVCEAHNQPKKYGLMGLILQLLFPPYTKTEDPNNVVSKYQLAARYGRQSNANCGVQYDGCVLNLLDIIQAMVNAFIR